MHELGIVVAIIKQVEEIAVANKVKRVTEVTLEIGEVSGIVPKYLTDAWKRAVDNRSTYLKGCKLNIITLKAKSFCTNCETAYDTMKYAKICPNCGSDKTYLLTGKEANIKDIKVEN